MRNQIHERIIKLKSQSKWIVRIFTLAGIILGFLFAFASICVATLTVTPGTAPDYIDTEGNVFEMGSLTITDGNGTNTITILDRNLGATQIGTSCTEYNSGACGYFFQWGNNYGFSNPLTKTGTQQVDTSDYSRDNPYVSDTFIQGNSNWSSIENDNLRGGSGDTTSSRANPDYMRQGPCPEGYHVPTYGELNTLKTLAGNNGKFANTGFFIPFAGYRYFDALLDSLGTFAFLRSSSPNAYNARFLRLNSNGYALMDYSSRAGAFSLRCIYDSRATDTSILSFDTRGGQRMQGQTVPTGGTGHTPGYNPKKNELPEGYTRVDYIGGTSNKAFFNTNIAGNNDNLKIEGEIKYTKRASRGAIWGNYVSEETNTTRLILGGDTPGIVYYYTNTKAGMGTRNDYFTINTRHKIETYQQSGYSTIKLNGEEFTANNRTKGTENSNEIYLNAVGNGNHSESINRFKYLKIYDDGILVRYYIPCKNSSGIYGMFDLITQTFHSSEGSMQFIGGPEIYQGDMIFDGRYKDEDYLEYFNFQTEIITGDTIIYAKWTCPEGYETPDGKICLSITDISCYEGQHIENGWCTRNTKIINCTQTGEIPLNSTYNIVNVTGLWNDGTNNWDIPACSWTCDTDYHTENGTTCVENTKTVACAQSGSKPANSSYNIVDVTGVWNSGTSNWDIPVCNWMCDTNYHTENGDSCVENTKTVTCDSSGVPTHATYIISNVQIMRSGTRNVGEWTDNENCAYNCDAGYELSQNGDCKKSNVQITFIANPATFSDGRFSGGITSKTLEYFFATGGYYAAKTEEIQIPQNPHEYDSSGNLLTGWMFEGWYLDTGYSASSRWTGLSVDTTYTGITLYARYLPFKDKRVTFDGVTFTIMDRNLGALDYSSGYSYRNEQSNNDRIGLYYQWGNNFGFPNDGTLQNTLSGVLIENHTNKERGQGNYYFNGSFVLGPKVFTTGTFIDNNLRNGGSTDEIGQGPCPVGYHIPQLNEFNTTINLFKKYQLTEEGITYCVGLDTSNTGIQYCMPAVLGLPFSSNRSYTTTQAQSYGAFIWTNTKVGNLVRTVIFVPSVSYITDTNNVGNGFTLRCFKDTTGVTLSYDSKGGTAVPSSTARRWFAKSTAPANPSRTGSTFAGWYRDTGYTQEFIFSGDTYISEDTTLYAKWTCKTGYEMDENGNCKKSNVQVTFVANPSTFPDGEFSGSVTSKTLEYFFATGGYYAAKTEEIQIPQNPHEVDLSGNLLTGWMFEGWYLDTGYSAASRWTGLSANTTYTGITLYARYLPFKDKTVTMDGVTFTIMDRNLGALDYSSGYSYDNEQSNETGPDGTRIRIGNYYQRGNNFGFPNKSNYNNKLTNSVSNYSNIVRGPGNYYFNGIFITNNPIYNEYNKNMWGGSGETQNNANSDIDKQGPCPIGYHIPSTYERISTVNLYNKRKNTTEGISYCSSMPSGDQFCMPAALGLPFDGYLGSNRAGLAALTTARFRSTNVNGRNIAYDLGFRSNILLPQYSDSMGYGLTIRCLKNTPDLVLNFDSKGGNNIQSKTGFKRWNPLTIASSKPNNPTRTNSTFAGWFRDTGYTNEFIFSGDTYISEDTTLYAKWTCNTGYIESLDGQSCEENILPYTINHYQENTGNNGYTLFESENKTGLSDNLTQATSKTYQGFTVQAFQQQTIQGNDTHVNIYYDRNVYTININLNGGTGPTSFTGKYGDTVVPPEITKSGYSIKKRVPALPETMPLNGFSSKPVRVLTDGSISISVNPNKNTLDLSIRGTSNSSRELTGAFTNDYFTISDTKGEENGYHATLSIGNLVGNNNENHIIPASNVQVKTDGIVRLSGTPSSEVGLTTTMTNWRTATGQVTYFTRGDIVIDDECKPGEYGIDLDLKITVPSHTIPDEYHGTITYTLYED